MEYLEFIQSKQHTEGNHGLKNFHLNDSLFDYQSHIAEYAIKKGRCAGFVDTGLGKTLIELEIARIYAKETNKPSLIITPLAVAFQFVKEAEKFGIDDVEYSKDGNYSSKIVICNYERLDKFDSSDFDCVILDESSILKNFKGAVKAQITGFLKKIKYRFLFTATPSPNDFIELGTSSEALGYMGYMDMLGKFFTNNENSIDPNKMGVKWVLKSHAQKSFFDWVSGWSISARKPSDVGFNDANHVLPSLNLRENKIFNESNLVVDGQGQLFAMPSTRLTEVREEQKATISQRCEKAVECAMPFESSVYWCNLNQESDMLSDIDKDAVEVRGSMNLDKKEEILIGFANGDIKRLITKPKITAFGLNWQHCNHTVYFPTFSYEQYYQAIRRFWRFGQKREVFVDLVYSDGQEKVLQSLHSKSQKADELFSKLNSSLNKSYFESKKEFNQDIIKPSF